MGQTYRRPSLTPQPDVQFRVPKVSEFVDKQIDIFDEFGLEIPKGSRPVSRKKPKAKKA